MKVRTATILVVLAAAMVAPALFAGKPGDEEDGLGGFRAFRRFLDAMNIENSEQSDPPARGTFFLRYDFRNRTEIRQLLNWVQSGGRLVLADPDSDIATRLGLSPQGLGGITSPTVTSPGCAAPETAGVAQLSAAAGEYQLLSVTPDAVSCFHDGRYSYLMELVRGNGKVVVLGGPSALTNEHLKKAENAVFASQLVAGGPVVFGPPVSPGAEPRSGLWGLLPTAAKVLIIQVGVMLLTVMFLVGRRLGKPRLEEPIIPIPSGEIVTAHADLLRGARDTLFAGRLVRDGTIRRLSRRVGLPTQVLAKPEEIVRFIENEKLKNLLAGPPPSGDDELIALSRDLETEVRDLEGIRK